MEAIGHAGTCLGILSGDNVIKLLLVTLAPGK
jgi:hypothetical protein